MNKQGSLVGVVSLAAVSVGAAILSACSYFKDRKAEEKRAAVIDVPMEGEDETEAPCDGGAASVTPSYTPSDKVKVIRAVGEITGLGTLEAGFLIIDEQWQNGELSWTKAVLLFSMAGDSAHRAAADQKLRQWNSQGVSGKRVEEIRDFLTEMRGRDLEDPCVAWAEMEAIMDKGSTFQGADDSEVERHCVLRQFLELFPAVTDYSPAQKQILRSMAHRLEMDRETMLRACRKLWTDAEETPEEVDREVERLAQRWDALMEER